MNQSTPTLIDKPQRPPLTVPPDEVMQGGIELAADGTLTAYAAQRVTWVYRCKEYDAKGK